MTSDTDGEMVFPLVVKLSRLKKPRGN